MKYQPVSFIVTKYLPFLLDMTENNTDKLIHLLYLVIIHTAQRP